MCLRGKARQKYVCRTSGETQMSYARVVTVTIPTVQCLNTEIYGAAWLLPRTYSVLPLSLVGSDPVPSMSFSFNL
jgi:hypothetical protein